MDMSVFTWIGILVSLYVALKFTFGLHHFLTTYVFQRYPDFSRYGEWTVVTGATDGIGKAIAQHLAAKGQKIVLIARNEEKLQKVSNEIESQYGVETKQLRIDFSHDESIYDKIDSFLNNLDIGVLVNNVGFGVAGSFLETPNLSNVLLESTRVNIFSVFKMHQIVLPGMVQRKRGLVINITGVGVLRPVGYTVLNVSAKAMHDYFSRAVSYELADKGITIQSVMPFFVPKTKNNFFTPGPYDFAASLLGTIGKGSQTYGCWQHVIQGWIYQIAPTSFLNNMMKKAVEDALQEKKTE